MVILVCVRCRRGDVSAVPGFPRQQSIREKQTANVNERTANSRNRAATNVHSMLCHNSVASGRPAVLFNSSKNAAQRCSLLNAVCERLLYVVRRSELPCEQAGCEAATCCHLGMITTEFECCLAVLQRLRPRHHHSWQWSLAAPQDNLSRTA